MTCGIYKLVFSDNNFYIGCSSNIEVRYSSHLYTMRNNLHSSKVQKIYSTLKKEPILEILEVCTQETLLDREVYWIAYFKATELGLNISEGGEDILVGEDNGSSKYSNEDIISLFHDLVKYPEISLKNMSVRHNISINVVKSISNRSRHLWLADKFPEEYKLLMSNASIRAEASLNNLSSEHRFKRSTPYPIIISPTGLVYQVNKLGQFAIEHNLQPGNLSQVLNGKRKTHKGWKLPN